jgi:hypothetical protein
MVSNKKIFMRISHRVLCEIKFGCGGHLGRNSEMPDTILEGDHPRIISAKLYKHNDEFFNIYYRIFYEL